MANIFHITSVHTRYDIRIFKKECISLAQAGHTVTLIVCDGLGDETCEGVRIIDAGNYNKLPRLKRAKYGPKAILKKLMEFENIDVVHFHDPELLSCGIKLKRLGKKVIFDSHEDVPAQILDKHWIPAPLRKVVSAVYKQYETKAVGQFDAVVAATPHIAEQFDGRAKKIVVINNYPRLDDIIFQTKPFDERERIVCYAGGINELRGEKVMVAAMEKVDGTLILAGDHDKITIQNTSGGGCEYIGLMDRAEINELYARSVVGLVVLQPAHNYVDSLPIKMFEYMAAGLPFVASDFPLWKSIVAESQSGICVNPSDTVALANAINFFLENKDVGQRMGQSGRKYVEDKCSWTKVEGVLLTMYETL